MNEDYKWQSVVAIHSLQSKYHHWPDKDEHNAIAQWIQQKFTFPNCVGLIDGTLNPFTYKPQMEDAVDYSRCKYGYLLSTLVVCDDMLHHVLCCWLAWQCTQQQSILQQPHVLKPYKLFHPSAVPTWGFSL